MEVIEHNPNKNQIKLNFYNCSLMSASTILSTALPKSAQRLFFVFILLVLFYFFFLFLFFYK